MQEGFKIQYLKRGNILQPVIQVIENKNLVSEVKSGFNPFYYAVPEKNESSDMEESISEVGSEF